MITPRLPLLLLIISASLSAAERPRVIVSTDLGGGDPDDFQSMVHYLVYADVFDTEGLISSPPKAGRASHLLECLNVYQQDFLKLKSWSPDYPSPDTLRKVVRQGATVAQPGSIPAQVSDGAQLIIDRAKVKDPRPLYVIVWGSITDIAQAVHASPGIKSKLRVYSIGSWNTRNGQKERDYLFNHHHDLWWIECDTTFRGMYMGGNQKGDLGNRQFPKTHVAGHGHLGDLFMRKKSDIKMGDTPSVLYLLHGDPGKPESDHWGGAFVRRFADRRPNYWHDNPEGALSSSNKPGAATVNRWRSDYLRHWQSRMDRCITKKP